MHARGAERALVDFGPFEIEVSGILLRHFYTGVELNGFFGRRDRYVAAERLGNPRGDGSVGIASRDGGRDISGR